MAIRTENKSQVVQWSYRCDPKNSLRQQRVDVGVYA